MGWLKTKTKIATTNTLPDFCCARRLWQERCRQYCNAAAVAAAAAQQGFVAGRGGSVRAGALSLVVVQGSLRSAAVAKQRLASSRVAETAPLLALLRRAAGASRLASRISAGAFSTMLATARGGATGVVADGGDMAMVVPLPVGVGEFRAGCGLNGSERMEGGQGVDSSTGIVLAGGGGGLVRSAGTGLATPMIDRLRDRAGLEGTVPPTSRREGGVGDPVSLLVSMTSLLGGVFVGGDGDGREGAAERAAVWLLERGLAAVAYRYTRGRGGFL